MGRTLLTATLLVSLTLAGCLGGEYRPGEDFKETGNTVHLRATVKDMLESDLYPGLEANLWAFCFEPADPDDDYSAAAIEYRAPTGTVQQLNPDGTFSVDQEQTSKCSVPGPTLRVQQGDTVIVDFVNDHVHPHTIHWHGQYVPWDSDGVPGSTQDSVKPGESYRYEFIASRAGTLWYHCHVDTQFHVMQGLYGVMIVEPQDDSWEPDVDRDQAWTLSTLKRDLVEATPERKEDPHADHKNLGECGVTGEQGCQNPAVDITPDTFLINGVSFPNTLEQEDAFIRLAPDERLRLRVLNAGTTWESIHTHGHDMLVTHVDGNPLPPTARYYVDTLPIAPAGRIDVVLEGRAGNEGVWVVHTHVVDHVSNDQQYPGGMLTKIVYPGFENDMTPFTGVERPGGIGYHGEPTIPDDYENGTVIDLGTDPAAEAVWSFPLDLPCALRSAALMVRVDSPTSQLQSLNDFTIQVVAPSGEVVWQHVLGAGREAVWRPDVQSTHPEEGAYTVIVSGQSLEAVLDMDVRLDYFDSIEEMEANGGCDDDH